MRLLWVVCLALLLCGCEQIAVQNTKDGLTYTQDPATKLCFAWCNAGSNSAVMTNVPCTPAVLELVKR